MVVVVGRLGVGPRQVIWWDPRARRPGARGNLTGASGGELCTKVFAYLCDPGGDGQQRGEGVRQELVRAV